MRIARLPAALAALLLLAAPGRAGPPVTTFKIGVVTLETGSGAHRITVELATDPQQREQGLMFRPTLGKDAGMLFLYAGEQPVSMWMKNTLIPLDMLFIHGDGTIASIRERAVPQSLETISSEGMVKAVLELNGGTVARLAVKPGDKVVGEGLGP
jgi:uncharacterized membrane protein (UPF0127 family)